MKKKTPGRSSYFEKLKDPRWQRRRLEVMQRANFMCEICADSESTLNVHHAIYKQGANPWEYGDDELKCLCETCHEDWHISDDEMKWHLAELKKSYEAQPYYFETISGYIAAITFGWPGSREIKNPSKGFLQGMADRYGIRVMDIMSVVRDGVLYYEDLQPLISPPETQISETKQG